MKSFLRILIVWLVLLALPFAGVASAASACCPPVGAQPMHHHDGEQHHACAQHHAGAQDHGGKHAAKCAHCAACCTAMLAPLAFAQPPLVPPASGHAIAFDAGHMPTVDPDHPERPPRFARA